MQHFLIAMPQGIWLFLFILLVIGYVYIWFSTILETANHAYKGKNTRVFWLFFTILTGFVGILLYLLLGKSDRLQKLQI
ncbi:MAG: hypothetical protein WEA59_07965 [Ferruginibacter sp.]